MIDRISPAPHDHVLFLAIDLPLVHAIAARLTIGSLVGLGDPDSVAEARRATRELDNVLFHHASPEEIPFRDGYFHRVIALGGTWPRSDRTAREIARVLAPGGRLYLSTNDSIASALAALGLVLEAESDDAAVWSR